MSPLTKKRIQIIVITLPFVFLLTFILCLELMYGVSTKTIDNGLIYSFYDKEVVQIIISGSLISAFFYPMVLTGISILMLIVNQCWKKQQTKMTLYSVVAFSALFIYVITSEAFHWFID